MVESVAVRLTAEQIHRKDQRRTSGEVLDVVRLDIGPGWVSTVTREGSGQPIGPSFARDI